MIENLQEKLHQGEIRQSKGAKICASIRWEFQYEKCSKTFWKIFGRQNMQNQTNTKHSSNLTLKVPPLKLPYLKF